MGSRRICIQRFSLTGFFTTDRSSEAKSDATLFLRDLQAMHIPRCTINSPSTIIHTFTVFNWLIGNPAGYLPDELPLEQIDIALTPHQLAGFGRAWIRAWEFWFFEVILIASLAAKVAWRLH